METGNILGHFDHIGELMMSGGQLWGEDDEICYGFEDMVEAVSHGCTAHLAASCEYLGIDEATAVLFMAIFSMNCEGRSKVGIDDIAEYLGIEISTLAQHESFERLIDGGFVENKHCFLPLSLCELSVCPNVLDAIVHAKPLTRELLAVNKSGVDRIKDQFTFVKAVSEVVDQVNDDNKNHENDDDMKWIYICDLSDIVARIEDAREGEIPFIKTIKGMIDWIGDRIFFYMVCDGFIKMWNHRVEVQKILNAIEMYSCNKLMITKRLAHGTHILIEKNLIGSSGIYGIIGSDMYVELSEAGKELLLGKNAV